MRWLLALSLVACAPGEPAQMPLNTSPESDAQSLDRANNPPSTPSFEREASVAEPPDSGTADAGSGLSAEAVRRVVVAHQGALRACFEVSLKANPDLRGTVTAAWRVEPDGAVSSARIVKDELGDLPLEGCIVRQIRTWEFPKVDRPTEIAAFPFKFGIGG